MIVILAKHPAWGAADNFYRAFKSCGYNSRLLCLGKDKYSRTSGEITQLDKTNLDFFLENSKLLFVCSPVTIATVTKKIDKNFGEKLKQIKNKIIFITGTEYIKNHKIWNKFLNYVGFDKRFSEAEMLKFNGNNKFLPHPMEYNIPIIKNDKITISHAPGIIERPEKKGTPIILSCVEKLKKLYDFEYDHIVGVPLSECLERKAKSHIFIDQINPNVGGLGKNGYEALSLNCITIASVDSFYDIKEKDRPPVINANFEVELYNRLSLLLSNIDDIKKRIDEISVWKENINYKNTVKKLGY